MNYSVNYAGFIDLANESLAVDAMPVEGSTENCKPAVAIQLYQGENIDELMEGIVIHNPIKRQYD